MRMDAPESPPAFEEMFLFRQREIVPKPLCVSVTFLLAFDLALKRFDKSRNGDQNRDALTPDRIHQVRRFQRIDKNNGACQHRRDEYPKYLAKHMTERKQVQKTKRVNQLFVPQILLYFVLQWFDVCEDVSVRNHDAPRLRSGAGGKDDFQCVLARKGWRGGRGGVVSRKGRGKRLQ